MAKRALQKNFLDSRSEHLHYSEVPYAFTMASEGGGVAYFYFENVSFLLQDFCAKGLAENFMMHLLVKNVDAWWDKIDQSDVITKYGVKLFPVETQPWRMRDFCLTDPSGVLWRIGQNIE